jgi:hypothetical protein
MDKIRSTDLLPLKGVFFLPFFPFLVLYYQEFLFFDISLWFIQRRNNLPLVVIGYART